MLNFWMLFCFQKTLKPKPFLLLSLPASKKLIFSNLRGGCCHIIMMSGTLSSRIWLQRGLWYVCYQSTKGGPIGANVGHQLSRLPANQKCSASNFQTRTWSCCRKTERRERKSTSNVFLSPNVFRLYYLCLRKYK